MGGLNNPLPSSLASECKKCSKILASFIDPSQTLGPGKFIPHDVLANAKGLAILSVIKAGFLGSARYGNGIVVARLSDGSWSAPSAIGTGGAGFGGQIGFELTDFVFILNDSAAVRTFSQVGSLTLGGNVSVAVGPLGRNAEAAGAASFKGVAGIFSYSKTKGIFAGVSLEGSAIVERRDANEKLYGHRYTASQLLSGSVPPPLAAQELLDVLKTSEFTSPTDPRGTRIFVHQDTSSKKKKPFGSGLRRSFSRKPDTSSYDAILNAERLKRANKYNAASSDQPSRESNPRPFRGEAPAASEYKYSDTPLLDGNQAQNKPLATRPIFKSRTGNLKKDEAVAMYSFKADQPGDLGFEKGEIITVTQATRSNDDWWTGAIGNRTGIFPANYVQMKS
ncbi:SH3 domain-containing protein [Podosphaera aphanis]|nr:SH3 domain-containing protein [Podosphaera aphanis]